MAAFGEPGTPAGGGVASLGPWDPGGMCSEDPQEAWSSGKQSGPQGGWQTLPQVPPALWSLWTPSLQEELTPLPQRPTGTEPALQSAECGLNGGRLSS